MEKHIFHLRWYRLTWDFRTDFAFPQGPMRDRMLLKHHLIVDTSITFGMFSILDSEGNVLTGSDGTEAKGECANYGLCDSHSAGEGQVISAPISAAGNYWIKVDAGNAARVPGNEYFVNVVLE